MTDGIALLPWAAGLSAIAVFFAWRAWKAGDRPAVVRRAGWALIPWALWMVGALRLAVRIGDAVVDWAVGFVFRPSVWLGIALAIVAVLMIVWGSRGKSRSKSKSSDRPAGLEPASNPSVTGAGKKRAKSRPSSDADDDDLSEIEDILRRHGIE